MTFSFPNGFVWGTATAAHQVEGGTWNNDWWAFEHTPGSGTVEPAGDACDHFWRYPADIAMLADLGFGAYRFSLEWSRIEPEEGEFSTAALDHYRRMCATTPRPRPAPRRHVPPLHDAALGRRPTAAGPTPRSSTGSRGSASGPSRTSATRSAWRARSTSRTSCR